MHGLSSLNLGLFFLWGYACVLVISLFNIVGRCWSYTAWRIERNSQGYHIIVRWWSSSKSCHCTKNHISQVPEYHGKLKKTKYISPFHHFFGWKKDRISHHRKVQNKNFSLVRKYHLCINFLTQKKTMSPITEKFKTRTFQ